MHIWEKLKIESIDTALSIRTLITDSVCVWVFVYPVAVDITKMISDRGGSHARLVRGTLLGTSTIILSLTVTGTYI